MNIISEKSVTDYLGKIVELLKTDGLPAANRYAKVLDVDGLKAQSDRHGSDRVEETCDALEDCRRAIADDDLEGALACAERAQERWANKEKLGDSAGA